MIQSISVYFKSYVLLYFAIFKVLCLFLFSFNLIFSIAFDIVNKLQTTPKVQNFFKFEKFFGFNLICVQIRRQ